MKCVAVWRFQLRWGTRRRKMGSERSSNLYLRLYWNVLSADKTNPPVVITLTCVQGPLIRGLKHLQKVHNSQMFNYLHSPKNVGGRLSCPFFNCVSEMIFYCHLLSLTLLPKCPLSAITKDSVSQFKSFCISWRWLLFFLLDVDSAT